MSEEWEPWIEHDGKGCPCVGMWVQMVFKRKGLRFEACGIAGERFDGTESETGSSWHWAIISEGPWWPVIRYRIRKPRAIQRGSLRYLFRYR
jgi:hypothetical protein